MPESPSPVIGKKEDNNAGYLFGLSIAAIVILLAAALVSINGIAQAALIPEEEHWKYHIDRWSWDSDRRKTIGVITPQIVIQNETANRLEGYVADANGTRLAVYDGEQVVQVRYVSNTSSTSGWLTSGRVHDGYFVINIPERFGDAERVRIYIGKHHYTVDNGTPMTPQTEVFFNSAILNYRTDSSLDLGLETVAITRIAEEPRQQSNIYTGGSLIDWILSQNGFLPVGGSDSGK